MRVDENYSYRSIISFLRRVDKVNHKYITLYKRELNYHRTYNLDLLDLAEKTRIKMQYELL